MGYSFTRNVNVLSVEFFDAIDLSNANLIQCEFDEVISKDFIQVFLSAKNLKYIDSSGVATLLMMKRRCGQLGCEFIITDISAAGYRVIELAKLTDLLPIKKVVDEDSGAPKKTIEFNDSFFTNQSIQGVQVLDDSMEQSASEADLDSLNFKPGSFL
ncbi:STAS domain-containing protein [Polynucleobacter sp. MG-6-Vaara-E2]|uniref:STAS domain-containing protein n=1 Tax=Polynucleobacter sp. MG-6-Vaara-E2 TaxID=2576932 RepID=UPI001BFD1325|nr:STAS domain-containing protein [Polynucleobacter sp. MG-6-Vaara-E2]QWD95953.1 STAS domain-containing protein [Polynucleobacter sp. MG-6-Vaara-E2]